MSINTPNPKSKSGGSGGYTPRTPKSNAPNNSTGATPTASVTNLAFTPASKRTTSMKQQKAGATKKAQSKTIFKPTMATPYQAQWDPLTLEQSHEALQLLTKGLSSLQPAPSSVPSSTTPVSTLETNPKLGKRKRDLLEEKESDVDLKSSSTQQASLPGICIGLNAVTRAASSGELSLIILCRNVTPITLISHLPIICQLKQIPLITLNQQINTRMFAHVIDDSLHPPPATHSAATLAPSASTKTKKKSSHRMQLCTVIGIKVNSERCLLFVPFSDLPDKKGKNNGLQKQQQQQKQQKAINAAAKQPTSSPINDATASSTTISASGSGSVVVTGGSVQSVRSMERIESATQRKKKQKLQHSATTSSSTNSNTQSMEI